MRNLTERKLRLQDEPLHVESKMRGRAERTRAGGRRHRKKEEAQQQQQEEAVVVEEEVSRPG